MTEPVADANDRSVIDSFGPRALRRAEPRASIAIAGAGCALAILGVLIISADTGTSGDDFNRAPGIVLSALVVGAGFVALANARRGPVATAGAVAAAAGVPPLMFFLTFDENGFPPYSTEAILGVSALAWLASYAAGPGRGRPVFLGAGLIGAWFTVLQVTEKAFDLPWGILGFFMGGFATEATFEDTGSGISGSAGMTGGFGEDFGASSFDAPDPTTMALISLVFGLVYVVAARRLDDRGRHGAATPFAFAALPTLALGSVLLADELEQAGTGLFMMAIGVGLAYHGSTTVRRVTTWVGGAATAIGAAVFLSDMTDDATIGGMLFVAAGIGLVAAGHALVGVIHEPDEMEPTLAGTVQDPRGPAAAPPGRPDLPPPPGAPPPDEPDDGT